MACRIPEVLAPAGDEASLSAALAAGADAVYLGFDAGFNARTRAQNFPAAGLDAIVARAHRAGARVYVTLNTLVHQDELAHVEHLVRRAAEAGADAVIVQDPAVALTAAAVCPELAIHASTQMTIATTAAIRFAAGLGARRVILPRELSVADIARLRRDGDPMELEVFVHGALCISWGGQCLASAAWMDRSANRGTCAQPCRLPYQVVVDGVADDAQLRYPLSPRDLSGWQAVSELAALGVEGLKIEGRQKGPAYVAEAVAGGCRWVYEPPASTTPPPELARLALTFSRGFCRGFLGGDDHQALLDGRCPKHRGLLIGTVAGLGPGANVKVEVAPGAPVPRPGQGVVFDAGRPEDDEPGGPIFRVEPGPGALTVGFGVPGPDLARVAIGQRVWLTSDPAIGRMAAKLAEGAEPEGRLPVRLVVEGKAGAPLRVRATVVTTERTVGADATAQVESATTLTAARGAGLTAALLEAKLAAFGGTPLRLTELEGAHLAEGLHLPVSELKAMRRQLVAALTAQVERGPRRSIALQPVMPRLLAQAAAAGDGPVAATAGSQPTSRAATAEPRFLPLGATAGPQPATSPALVVLCRRPEHVTAALAAGHVAELELDLADPEALAAAAVSARAAGLRIAVATLRVEKPGEEPGLDARLLRLRPDGILVRSPGALLRLGEAGRTGEAGGGRPTLHGDASLNVANSLTAGHLFRLGLSTVTPALDLPEAALQALLAALPGARVTIPLRRPVPAFHAQHCLFARLLSRGRDSSSCGRPCQRRTLALRDNAGRAHPVTADAACRNTLWDARPRSLAHLAPWLRALGVRRFRVELLGENHDQAERAIREAASILAAAASQGG